MILVRKHGGEQAAEDLTLHRGSLGPSFYTAVVFGPNPLVFSFLLIHFEVLSKI